MIRTRNGNHFGHQSADYGRYFTLGGGSLTLGVMKLQALLMCRSQPALRVLAAALDEVGIEGEVCPATQQAMELIARNHYAALILDLELPGSDVVLRMARLAPLRKRPVIFAMIGAMTNVASAFQYGANFVLYKPLAQEQVIRSLRAGRGFMHADRRRSDRHAVEAFAYIGFRNFPTHPALVLDVNEGGISIQASAPLPAEPSVDLRFLLPGTNTAVEGTAEIAWVEENGRAGLIFSHLRPAGRRQLDNWLRKRSGAATHQAPAPAASQKRAAAAH